MDANSNIYTRIPLFVLRVTTFTLIWCISKTLELPANRGMVFSELFRVTLADVMIFFIVRIVAGTLEIIIGIALVIGFLLRMLSFISTVILTLIVIALIPSWFMVIVHGLPLFLSVPMIFMNSNSYAPAEKYIPQSMRKWQAK